eukprot:SAG31_NODE_2663_length_5278_cov_29.536011_5_plen_90_part_00
MRTSLCTFLNTRMTDPEPGKAPPLIFAPECKTQLQQKTKLGQFTKTIQGFAVHVLVVAFTNYCFIWVGSFEKAMPNLAAAAANKYVRIA